MVTLLMFLAPNLLTYAHWFAYAKSTPLVLAILWQNLEELWVGSLWNRGRSVSRISGEPWWYWRARCQERTMGIHGWFPSDETNQYTTWEPHHSKYQTSSQQGVCYTFDFTYDTDPKRLKRKLKSLQRRNLPKIKLLFNCVLNTFTCWCNKGFLAKLFSTDLLQS